MGRATSPAFFLFFIIAVLVLADNGSLPQFIHVLDDFPNGAKVGYCILF